MNFLAATPHVFSYLQKNYWVVLEPNLSPHLYKFSQTKQMVQGGHDTHVTFRFTAEVNSSHCIKWVITCAIIYKLFHLSD